MNRFATVLFALSIAGAQIIVATPMSWSGSQNQSITASCFKFTPSEITVRQGDQVTLELTSSDRPHGFNVPDLGLRSEIIPGKVTKVSFTADKLGSFDFFCDVFCGSGHEDMAGKIIVTR